MLTLPLLALTAGLHHVGGVPARSRLRLARHPGVWLPGARLLRWRRFEHAFRAHLHARRSSTPHDSRWTGG